MKLTDTLVSIILPICNAERYLEVTLQSLLRQTYQNIEIIAIDDDSRDNSYKILREVAKGDKRLKFFKNKKRYGLGVCLNRALAKSRGKYVTFMNASDISGLHRIKRQVSYLLQNPQVVAVGTQRYTLGDTDKRLEKSIFPLSHDEIYHTLVAGKVMQFESALINRALLPKDLLKFSGHPYPLVFSEVFVKLIQYGKLANLNQHLYYHRELASSRKRVKQSGIERKISVAQLFVKSVAVYDYRPSVKALMQPLLSPVKTLLD
jgi:glycosyltransferase involved in cell wall biosynthesis